MAKEKTRFEALGDFAKSFENMQSSARLMPGLPILMRLDGIGFSKFTKGMTRPFHAPMSYAMIETARHLVAISHADFAYTQSDEITLGFLPEDAREDLSFSGRVQKLVSTYAAKATSRFQREAAECMPERLRLEPVFDARVWNVPDLDVLVESVLFRALDCQKNSITMAARAYYSHKEVMGKSSADKHEMLHAKGVNWAEYPRFFKDGTFLRRSLVEKTLTPTELARIPEGRKPTGPVMRSVIAELDLPPFARITNPKEVLFKGAKPEVFVPQIALAA